MQDAIQSMFQQLLKDDRIFLIMFLGLFIFGCFMVLKMFKRHLKTLDKMEKRSEKNSNSSAKLIQILEKVEAELVIAHQTNEKLVDITKQQQKYIDDEKAHRNIIVGVDQKLNTLLTELAKNKMWKD
ncbi:hypothetical protein AOA01_00375 [Listeria monocytogenes]|nr:hypothetical protein [Listeria monocytogenes]KXS65742.1 hypothetical protein AWJ02_01420 [Listeria monocytogenes]KXW92897.1 hypothetical protein AWJ00_08175 [Listeria monocytogenes]